MRRIQRDLSGFPDWFATYGITMRGVGIETTLFGSGIVALEDIQHEDPMIHVPAGLILSLDYVWRQAKTDAQLEEVLEALGDFAKVS